MVMPGQQMARGIPAGPNHRRRRDCRDAEPDGPPRGSSPMNAASRRRNRRPLRSSRSRCPMGKPQPVQRRQPEDEADQPERAVRPRAIARAAGASRRASPANMTASVSHNPRYSHPFSAAGDAQECRQHDGRPQSSPTAPTRGRPPAPAVPCGGSAAPRRSARSTQRPPRKRRQRRPQQGGAQRGVPNVERRQACSREGIDVEQACHVTAKNRSRRIVPQPVKKLSG